MRVYALVCFAWGPRSFAGDLFSFYGEYKEENEQTYIVGTTENETQSKFATSTESQKVDGCFEHLLTGEGNLELKEKDIVTFELKNLAETVGL